MIKLKLARTWLLGVAVAHAQSQGADPKSEARAHFQRGLALVQGLELEAALAEFRAAYTQQPHYSVLYNIARAEVALSRPREAIVDLERYLEEGGSQLSEVRRTEVTQLIVTQKNRLGQLRFIGELAGSKLWLDGESVEAEQLNRPLALLAGNHTVVFSDANMKVTSSQRLMIAPGSLTTLPLEPLRRRFATALPRCSVPGAQIRVNNELVGVTPFLGGVTVDAGSLKVRFIRDGYLDTTETLAIEPGATLMVPCALSIEPQLPIDRRGSVSVRSRPADATVRIDGQMASPKVLLPLGLHVVAIERDGFIPTQRIVEVSTDRNTRLDIVLVPTKAESARRDHERRSRRALGYTVGGVGIAFLVGAGGLFAWNSARYGAWQGDIERATSIQRWDDAAIGCATLGTSLVATAAWLLWTAPPASSSP